MQDAAFHPKIEAKNKEIRRREKLYTKGTVFSPVRTKIYIREEIYFLY